MKESDKAARERKERLNQMAYEDVRELEEPRYPDDIDYMKSYRFWRSIADWPEDRCEEVGMRQ